MFPFLGPASQYPDKINGENFTSIALDLFRYQYANNAIYHSFVDALSIDPATVSTLTAIPFLPISFFKTHLVTTTAPSVAPRPLEWLSPSKPSPPVTPSLACPELDEGRSGLVVNTKPNQSIEDPLIFRSSTTTGTTPSQHLVPDPALYEVSLLRGFTDVYGPPSGYAILGLLPSYLERPDASLVYMARILMRHSGHPACDFYLRDYDRLHASLLALEAASQPTILLGVTFALLDFATAFPMSLHHTTILETGGMKGRAEEWTRSQVHDYLASHLNTSSIHSEYGMTELLSQAYAAGDDVFRPSSTMRVLVREPNDPLTTHASGSGQLQIIDLANAHSCAFIATEDIGTVHPDGSFTVLGRADHSALRGCSLMAV